MVELGHTPWDAARLLKELTAPELEDYARSRMKSERYARHFEAVRLQWFLVVAGEVMRYAFASGYLQAKGLREGQRLPELKLQKLLDDVPGFDKEFAPKRRKRRR